jgi:hypothetical protein
MASVLVTGVSGLRAGLQRPGAGTPDDRHVRGGWSKRYYKLRTVNFDGARMDKLTYPHSKASGLPRARVSWSAQRRNASAAVSQLPGAKRVKT